MRASTTARCLSRAEFVRYPHADVAALEQRLAASTARRKLIATDAVFSMDGDIAPLPALAALADAYDAWLVVDDAHGFGVLGAAPNAGAGRSRISASSPSGSSTWARSARRPASPARSSPRIRPSSTPSVETARLVRVHDGRPAAARRSAAREPPDHPRRRGAPRASRPADRAFSRAHARLAVAASRLADRDSACHRRRAMRRRSISLPRCGSADSGCPRSGRRRFRRGPRGCACRSAPRTRPSDVDALAERACRAMTAASWRNAARVDERDAARRIGRQRPPLVLLHGWAMHSGIWGPLVGRLARRFRVHAVDLPGHGHSALAAPFTLDSARAAVSSCGPGRSGSAHRRRLVARRTRRDALGAAGARAGRPPRARRDDAALRGRKRLAARRTGGDARPLRRRAPRRVEDHDPALPRAAAARQRARSRDARGDAPAGLRARRAVARSALRRARRDRHD